MMIESYFPAVCASYPDVFASFLFLYLCRINKTIKKCIFFHFSQPPVNNYMQPQPPSRYHRLIFDNPRGRKGAGSNGPDLKPFVVLWSSFVKHVILANVKRVREKEKIASKLE